MVLRVAQQVTEMNATVNDTGVPGLAITLPLVAMVVVGIWLIIDGTRADKETERDPYWHAFDPDVPWGPVQRCAEWVEDDEGNEVRCGLGRAEHGVVYGAVTGRFSPDDTSEVDSDA